jgi:hypothetical protein
MTILRTTVIMKTDISGSTVQFRALPESDLDALLSQSGAEGEVIMDYDTDKVDEVVLALLHLNARTDHGITRAWKAFDWDAMDRLHARGFISDPKSKAKSVRLTDEGARGAEEQFRRFFGKAE